MFVFLALLAGQSLDAPLKIEPAPDLGGLAAAPGFPREALLKSPNKMLRVGVTIGKDGNAANCDIAESSGDREVDRAVCAAVRKYSRFTPWKDASGQAVYGRFEAPVTVTASADIARQLGSLFGISDYPPEALLKREEGTVGYDLDIGVNGKVRACTVTQSSGSTSLDKATCQILRSRARFKPEIDATGHPIPSRYQSQVGWHLPH